MGEIFENVKVICRSSFLNACLKFTFVISCVLFQCRMFGEIGLKHMEFLPEIIPVFITFLNDTTPAVARQAITCAFELFRCTLEKIAIQVALFHSL